MLLCDIGNTNIHFYKNGATWSKRASVKNISLVEESFYYISVNENLSKFLKNYELAKDLAPYIKIDTIYKNLGIDRVAACKAIENGVIVDAGSAITVDIVAGGIHLGGYIMPGLISLQDSFAKISKKLDMTLQPNVSLEALPQNTLEAISYGAIKPIILMIKESKKDKKIYFTGGDGKFFAKFFEDSIYDGTIVFRGMLKTIKERGLSL